MKPYKKFLSLRHYVAVLRRQPRHIQHVYAAIMSGIVTASIGAIILYHDYGFWRERYTRNEVIETVVTPSEPVEVESPQEMIHGFLREASVRLKQTESGNIDFLTGREEYKQEQSTTTGE